MLELIYRCCEDDQKANFRPQWFSKVKALKSLVKAFGQNEEVNLHAIHDGPIGPLYDLLQEYNFNIDKINVRSNGQSLEASLGYAVGLYKSELLYFAEDDYVYTNRAYQTLIDGYSIHTKKPNEISFISGYDHPDRLTRTDDLDHGRTFVYCGEVCHWRTAESTTCTWTMTQDDFLDFGYKLAIEYGLNDRGMFRAALGMGKRLITPMPGFSTHCHLPFLSPVVDWEKISNEIL